MEGRAIPKRKPPHPIKVTYADGSTLTVSGAHFDRQAKPKRSPTKAAREHWRRIKREALRRDDHRCVDCGRSPGHTDPRIRSGNRTRYLEVHHLTYERLGAELLEDVVTLCQRCHSLRHTWAIREGKPLTRPRP